MPAQTWIGLNRHGETSSIHPDAPFPAADVAIHHGDAHQVMDHLPSYCIDLVCTDPPYLLSGRGTTSARSGRRVAVDKGAWDSALGPLDRLSFHAGWIQRARRILRANGSLWVSVTHHSLFAVGHALELDGWTILNVVAWCKPNASPNLACRMLTHSVEYLIWAVPHRGPRLVHRYNYAAAKSLLGDGKQVRDYWVLPTIGSSKTEKMHGAHPTQKPLALLERVMTCSAAPGDVVLDPFMGSGTTGIAAARAGAIFYGVESDSKYFNLARRRIGADLRRGR